jgi:hypothetical protein
MPVGEARGIKQRCAVRKGSKTKPDKNKKPAVMPPDYWKKAPFGKASVLF